MLARGDDPPSPRRGTPRDDPRTPKRGQGGGYLFRLYRECGIAAITHEPLEFHAHALRRARLKADTVNLRFRVGLGKPRPLDHDSNTT